MLTYLDSLMIENPAYFQSLSARQLTAVNFSNRNDFNNLGNITNAGNITNDSGNIFTVGLSTQRLSADVGNFASLSSVNARFTSLTAASAVFPRLSALDAVITNLTAVNVKFEDSEFGEVVNNQIYVSMTGNDGNSGRNIFDAFRTIKRACEFAHNQYYQSTSTTLSGRPDISKKFTIFVGTGDYEEENPIYVPPNTSIIGDNLRRTSVIPKYKMYDLFWCNTSVYIWGFTFRGHCEPCACTAFPNLEVPTLTAIALKNLITPKWSNGTITEWRYPYVTTSPYIQGSSSICRMLTAGRFTNAPLSAQSFVGAPTTPTWNASAVSFHLDRLFDDITLIMLSGENAAPARTNTGSNLAINTTWNNLLTANTNFIALETEAFIRAAYRPISQGGLALSTLDYGDGTKCRRDVQYILSAIRADMVNGNNEQSRFNANFYWTQNTEKVTGDGEQVPATVTGLEFAKKLLKDITFTPAVSAPPIFAGAGMRVDGTKAEGFLRSFVLDSYTQFNEGGLGIHILKNGYAQLVSIFTINCTVGLLAESGGQMSVNNSNCSFGLSGIVANGKSLTPVLTGWLLNNVVEETQPDQLFLERVDGTLIVPNSKYRTEGNVIGVDTRKLTTSPYNGMVFTLGNDPTLWAIRDQPLELKAPADAPGAGPGRVNPQTWYTGAARQGGGTRGRVFQLATTTFIFPIGRNQVKRALDGTVLDGLDGGVITDLNSYLGLGAYWNPPNNENAGVNPSQIYVQFYLRSTVTTSSHTMEYIGSGILLEQSVPGLGGRANSANEAVSINGGGTYYTSTDQVGNFRVGPGFTIVQETGLIEGDTFKRAMLALMTPLILALE